jgi:hypothetical protein
MSLQSDLQQRKYKIAAASETAVRGLGVQLRAFIGCTSVDGPR